LDLANNRQGLGTDAPTDWLHIKGSNAGGRTGIHVEATSSTGNATFYFENDRGSFGAYGGVLTGGSANANSFFGVTRADKTFLIADGASSLGMGIGTLTAMPLIFGTNNVEAFRIISDQKIGIGTSLPTALLSIKNTADNSGGGPYNFDFWNTHASGQARFNFKRADLANVGFITYSNSSAIFTIGTSIAIPLYFATNDTTRGVIDANGLFGFGTTSPTAVVHIKAGTATANTAPLKLTSGTNNTTAEPGAFEYNGTNLFFTRTGTTREGVLVGNGGATAPATSIGVGIVNYYGTAATNFLGDPVGWFSIVDNGGTARKVPYY
jgi:hypothetical protein